MYYTVYKTTNTINGKIYIGIHQTSDLDDGYLGSGKILKRAIKKYGEENFINECLHVFDNKSDMISMEASLVNEGFVADPTTYNLKRGGEGGFDYINQNELRGNTYRKNSHNINQIKNTKLKDDPAFRNQYGENISSGLKRYYETHDGSFTGRKHTEEKKQQHSDFMKGRFTGKKNSQYGSMWITKQGENRKIKKNDPIPEGWKKGRK